MRIRCVKVRFVLVLFVPVSSPKYYIHVIHVFPHNVQQ